MRKNFNGKVLFTIFVLCCFMATGLWAAKKVELTKSNSGNYINQLNQNKGFESTSMESIFGLSADEKFNVLRSRTDFNRVTHFRYRQSYKNIPVWGIQTVISKNPNGDVIRLHGAMVLDIPGDIGSVPGNLDPLGSLKDMRDEHKKKEPNARWNFENEEYGTYVYINEKGKAKLCYVVSFFADTEEGNPTRMVYFVNVKNGKVIHSYDNLQHADGTGPGGNLKVGEYYYGPTGDYPPFGVTEAAGTCTMNTTDVVTVDLNHTTSGTTPYSYACYENTHEAINGAYCPLNDAQYFGQVVYDMYQNWYGLPVLPFQLMMRVHYSTNYENAFWNGSSMTFGDGYTTFHPLVCLDVSAHEVAHGFTDNHSDLIYSGESGGINEAYSDMAGEAAEYYSRDTNDFMCGYDIFKAAGQALRYLYDPPLDGISIDHIDDYYSGMDVHYSSGIYNKVFWVLATTTGWDTQMAFDIFTKANVDYWTPGTTFQQGAEGAIDAAVDYAYPCQAVVNAFAVVGITVECPGPPIADFTGAPTIGGVPLTVSFTDLSTAASSWLWDFGDTGTSTVKNPSHVYTAIGTYTVTLTATNSEGSDTEVKTGYITVTAPQPPVADFVASGTDILVADTVTFTDLTTENPATWNWTFEGGTPASSTDQNPSVQYNTAGTYTVTLTATNPQGTDTETKVGYIKVSTIPYCDSQGNTFSMEWVARVQVDNLDNASGAAGYTDFTSITEDLDGGNTVGVTLTPGFSGSVYTEYWKIWIDYNGDHDFIDAGEEVFSGVGSSTVTGSFTVASGVNITTRMRVSMKYAGYPTPCETFTYGEVEDYTVVIADCPFPAPVADFTASAVTITEGDSVAFTDLSSNNPDAWSWTFAGGTPGTSTQQNPTVTYNTPGIYTVTLTATNGCGSGTETKVDYITVEAICQPPVVDFTASATTIYTGESVTFTDLTTNSPDTWNWTFAGGTPGTGTQQNPTVTYNTAGTYTVTLTASNACGSDTETKVGYITVSDIPDEMYVYDITQTGKKMGKNYQSTAVVTIWDTNNAPVADAAVSITWSGVVSGSASGVTGADGTVSFVSSKLKSNGPFIITVDNVTHAVYTYNPALNNETTDSATF